MSSDNTAVRGSPQPTAANSWRETVRDVFDLLMLSRTPATPLERRILEVIETRHHAFFCEGKTMAEWERSRQL